MKLSDADVQEIIRLLDDSDYAELEIETAAFRLTLRRAGPAQNSWVQQRQTLAEPRLLRPEGIVPASAAAAAVAGGAELAAGLEEICAPMVGTFYRSPRPGAEPFVAAGARVGRDTVVAIIEVMKLMNSVAAGVAGEIVEVCVDDASLVREGQRLMLVRPLPDPPGEGAPA